MSDFLAMVGAAIWEILWSSPWVYLPVIATVLFLVALFAWFVKIAMGDSHQGIKPGTRATDLINVPRVVAPLDEDPDTEPLRMPRTRIIFYKTPAHLRADREGVDLTGFIVPGSVSLGSDHAQTIEVTNGQAQDRPEHESRADRIDTGHGHLFTNVGDQIPPPSDRAITGFAGTGHDGGTEGREWRSGSTEQS